MRLNVPTQAMRQTICSVQALSGLDDTYSHWGQQPVLLSSTIQLLTSSSPSQTHPEMMFNLIRTSHGQTNTLTITATNPFMRILSQFVFLPRWGRAYPKDVRSLQSPLTDGTLDSFSGCLTSFNLCSVFQIIQDFQH